MLSFDLSKFYCRVPRIWLNNNCVCPYNLFYVSGSCMINIPITILNDILALKFINRNHDGTGNNKNNPFWGAKATPIKRLCQANY